MVYLLVSDGAETVVGGYSARRLFRACPTTFVINCEAEPWNNLRGESFESRSVVGGEQEGADPVFNGTSKQLVNPL
jgi:hypothetical protein